MTAKARTDKGTLFVISAPSGTGKTTLCRRLLNERPNMRFSVSYTTRGPRPGEADGVDYSFVNVERFKVMIEQGEFAEWAEVHGNYYGTSIKRLDAMLSEGFDVLLDIDVQGARQIRNIYSDAVYVFILPPSKQALGERLSGRNSDHPEVVARRLAKAKMEINEYKLYDYVIINDVLERAYAELVWVVEAAGLRAGTVDEGWIEETFS